MVLSAVVGSIIAIFLHYNTNNNPILRYLSDVHSRTEFESALRLRKKPYNINLINRVLGYACDSHVLSVSELSAYLAELMNAYEDQLKCICKSIWYRSIDRVTS